MMKLNRQNTLVVAIQIIGWGILFAIPLFFSPNGKAPITSIRYLEYIFVPLSFMVVFYLNYFVIIKRYLLQKRNLLLMIITNVVLIISVAYGVHLIHEYVASKMPHEGNFKMPPIFKFFFILRDAMGLSLTAALAVAVKMTSNWYATEYERKELEKAKSEAELTNLKSQLNPHFLFNTLNNIYSLVAIDKERAQGAIHDLSHLLRYVLYENNQNLVPLNKEVSFVRSYIDLMSMRLSSNFHSHVELPSDSNALIAPMLLITLVENAFKHGISSTQECFLQVELAVDQQKQLTFTVVNSNYSKQTNTEASGIGLENLKKRLELIYTGRYSLCLENLDRTFVSRLTIKLNNHEC